MTESGLCITGYCEISNGCLLLNGKKVISSEVNTLEETLSAIVSSLNVVHPRFGKMDRLAQLGYTCVEVLLQGKESIRQYNPEDICLMMSNSSSSLDTDYRYNSTLEAIPSPALFVYTLPNVVLAEICIKNGFKGENLFFISNTYDTNFMFNQINTLFENGRAKACITGWIDVLENSYRGVVFLVENKTEQNKNSINFSIDNISAIFNK